MSETDITPLIYGLEFQSRSLVGLYSNNDEVRFAAGTQFLRSKNQIHILSYCDEFHELKNRVFNYENGEIWNLTTDCSNPNSIIVTYLSINSDYTEASARAHIVELPEDENDVIKIKTELPTKEIGDVKQILSCPLEDCEDLTALIDGYLVTMAATESHYNVLNKFRLEGRTYPKYTVGSWSPHHGSKTIAAASDTNLYCWDIRTMKVSSVIENAHSQLIRDIDHNPNRQYYLASSGDDCKIKIWDLRNLNKIPVKEVDVHSHWVWKIRYNPFHDELLLSGGSDSMVALHLAHSVSSEDNNGNISDDDDEFRIRKDVIQDGLIQVYEEHEDSVYSLDWSPVDPWIFSSLSYDGRLVINQVPRKIKYNILL